MCAREPIARDRIYFGSSLILDGWRATLAPGQRGSPDMENRHA